MIKNERLMERFIRYVKIDSESGSEGEMCRCLLNEFEEMGLHGAEIMENGEIRKKDGNRCENEDAPAGHTIMVLMEGDSFAEPLILAAHMDTVTPGRGIRPVLCEDGYLRSEGDTILASDDKSGIAAIMEAVETVLEKNLPHRTVQIFFTVGEETGLKGSKAVDPSLYAARYAVVMDTSKDVGRIVTSAPGQLRLEADVLGKAAHAGNAPEQGISAIRVAARAVNEMKLQRIDHETTANIGTFEAVGSTNIISPKARLVFEIRSRNTEKLYAQAEHMIVCLKNACAEMGGLLDYNLSESYLGYQIPDGHPLVQQVFAACKKVGAEPFTAATGGGSDANVFNQMGLTAVNIATGMENVHTTGEQMAVKNLEKIAAVALELICI